MRYVPDPRVPPPSFLERHPLLVPVLLILATLVGPR